MWSCEHLAFITQSPQASIPQHNLTATFSSILDVCSGNTKLEKILLCLTAFPCLSPAVLKAQQLNATKKKFFKTSSNIHALNSTAPQQLIRSLQLGSII